MELGNWKEGGGFVSSVNSSGEREQELHIYMRKQSYHASNECRDTPS